MSTFRFVLVLLAPPFFKRSLLASLCGARIGRHVHVGWFSAIAARSIEMGDFSELRSFSVIRCGGRVEIGEYAIVSNFVWVSGAASLILGRHSFVGRQCLIDLACDVRLGDRSALGPRCTVYTHAVFLPYTEGYWTRFDEVTIGNGSWIAAGVFIHPGVRVGDDVFVNARSVLKGSVPSGAVMEGFPAVRVTDTARLRRRMTPKRVDEAMREMLAHFERLVLSGQLGVAARLDGRDGLRFTYQDRPYVLRCVPSAGTDGARTEANDGARRVLLVNRPSWNAPAGPEPPLLFDFTTMRTPHADDAIHRRLWEFLRAYYGVTFEYD